ncbi:MAG: GIY-YIG nuclease family protein [Nonlabens sp.]
MFTIYAIKSVHRNYIYVGLTADLTARLDRHNSGKNKTTAPYAPFILIYTEKTTTRTEARIREKYWKSGTGKEQLKKL